MNVYVSHLKVKFQYVNWVGNKFISAYMDGKNLNPALHVAIMYEVLLYLIYI